MDINIAEIKNLKTLSVDFRLLFTLIWQADMFGRVLLSQTALARYINTSRQTIGKYLRQFNEANMLKYKYSGVMMLNPEFIYFGDVDDKEYAKNEYKAFRSDV